MTLQLTGQPAHTQAAQFTDQKAESSSKLAFSAG